MLRRRCLAAEYCFKMLATMSKILASLETTFVRKTWTLEAVTSKLGEWLNLVETFISVDKNVFIKPVNNLSVTNQLVCLLSSWDLI